ncbi:MAG TPA: S-methyl-5'-thioadenosine phosphorylase [Dehalococcoidia bacterium]|nr:S-methyl-5'-thioadenosine phosphorylase [Dehalococcoidia bacterium]
MVEPLRAAVIGGSGFYQMEGLSDIETLNVDTPFGAPSDAITIGTLDGGRVAFLPRHGVGHRILPGEIPARANIWALKQLGVEFIISVSAVGSLREDLEPLHMVVPDQLIDRTRGRISTFFGDGLVAHIAFGDPFCPDLRGIVSGATRETEATVHNGGTYVVMEGPAFSTRAESNLYRTWGADIIGMTALPEAKLAREAEICFAVLACSTDYDCWHDAHEDVTGEMIVQNLLRNVEVSRQAVRAALGRLPVTRECACKDALKESLITAMELVPEETKRRLAPIIGRYLEAPVSG